MRAFGAVEDVLNVKTLLHEQQDELAKGLHAGYCTKAAEVSKCTTEDAKAYLGQPARKPWEELSEAYRDSNRQAADHIPIKLRAIGLSLQPENTVSPITEFRANQVQTLAWMEHQRWWAEKWLNGWRYGQLRDDDRKTHPDLVSWKTLADPERRIDIDLVNSIFEAAKRAQKAVCVTPPQPEAAAKSVEPCCQRRPG